MPIGSWAPPQLPGNRLEIRIHCSKLRVQPSQLAHLLLLGRYKELSIHPEIPHLGLCKSIPQLHLQRALNYPPAGYYYGINTNLTKHMRRQPISSLSANPRMTSSTSEKILRHLS